MDRTVMCCAGDVVRLKFPYSDPPDRNKFCLCICPEKGYFFIINSEPRREMPDAQIAISVAEFPCLRYESYLNAGAVFELPADCVSNGIIQGRPTEAALKRIGYKIRSQPYLAPRYIKLIQQNWPQ